MMFATLDDVISYCEYQHTEQEWDELFLFLVGEMKKENFGIFVGGSLPEWAGEMILSLAPAAAEYFEKHDGKLGD